MLTVAEARAKARSKLTAAMAVWAARPAEAAGIDIALHPPTEAQVLTDQRAAAAWAASWRAIAGPESPNTGSSSAGSPNTEASTPESSATDGVRIDWAARSWARVGRQQVPVRLRLSGAEAVAGFVGGDPARRWRCLRDRAATMRARFGETEALASAIRAHGRRILGLDDEAFTTLIDVVDWLRARPVGRLRPRQLPIRGVDSKWFEAHRSLVTALLTTAGSPAALDVLDAEARIRMRILDEHLAPHGLTDITAGVSDLDALDLSPEVVFVFENLESVLAMPAWPGAVVIHGSGYAVDAVARLGWVASTRVIYWGDLDSHGFAILARLRAHLPAAASALMDETTLLDHRDLWVSEPRPHTGRLSGLNGTEVRALARIRAEGDVRLEQERIPWATALASLAEAVDRPGAPSGTISAGTSDSGTTSAGEAR